MKILYLVTPSYVSFRFFFLVVKHNPTVYVDEGGSTPIQLFYHGDVLYNSLHFLCTQV